MSNYDSEAARAAWAAAAHIPATALQASSLGKQFIIFLICLYLKVRSMNQNKFKESIKTPHKSQQFMVPKVDQTTTRNILIILIHFSLQQTVSYNFNLLK